LGVIRIIGVRSTLAFFTLAAVALAAVAYLNARTTLEIRSTASIDTRLPVVAIPGYRLRVFTSASATNVKWKDAPQVSNPDSVVVFGGRVFIDYQNVTAKGGSDGKSSTVVEYTMQGEALKRWDIPGHSDGMRMDPATHVLWTTSNEDGNPAFATIDPASDKVTKYTFPAPPHQGGYDDVYFLNGKAFIAASNPTLDSNGNNVFPAVDLISLNDSDHSISLKPILMGNATATDSISKQSVTLNLTDPDSLSTDGKGNLVLVSQADSELITISNPGEPSQAVTRLGVGDQPDDTVYPSGKGRLLVVDAGGTTYWMTKDGAFAPGSVYTQAPNDSGVTNFVGTVDTKTGFITPIAIGFTKTTGMVFVPND
jgi:hypothetical protein